jgi:hypothetical protein
MMGSRLAWAAALAHLEPSCWGRLPAAGCPTAVSHKGAVVQTCCQHFYFPLYVLHADAGSIFMLIHRARDIKGSGRCRGCTCAAHIKNKYISNPRLSCSTSAAADPVHVAMAPPAGVRCATARNHLQMPNRPYAYYQR